MKRRCYNKNDKRYKNYGGRGIVVCNEWVNDYSCFKEWAYSSGYKPDAKIRECTLDRIDNNKNYSPDNCRWINNKEQQNNTSRVRHVEYNNDIYTLSQLSSKFNVDRNTLYRRIFVENWPIEKALTTPLMQRYVRHKKESDIVGASTQSKQD